MNPEEDFTELTVEEVKVRIIKNLKTIKQLSNELKDYAKSTRETIKAFQEENNKLLEVHSDLENKDA